ncbi:hypothetical protein ACJJTC_000484 [Scirpophaga incertulas]
MISNMSASDIRFNNGHALARGLAFDELIEPNVNLTTMADHEYNGNLPLPLDEINIGIQLSSDELNETHKLLIKYRDCFALNTSELGKINLVEMSIKLKDDVPIVYNPYLDALTAANDGQPDNEWDHKIPQVQWGLNNTINKGTGKTPSELLFGVTPTGVSDGSMNEIVSEVHKYINRDQPKCSGPYRIVRILGKDRYEVEDTPITKRTGKSVPVWRYQPSVALPALCGVTCPVWRYQPCVAFVTSPVWRYQPCVALSALCGVTSPVWRYQPSVALAALYGVTSLLLSVDLEEDNLPNDEYSDVRSDVDPQNMPEGSCESDSAIDGQGELPSFLQRNTYTALQTPSPVPVLPKDQQDSSDDELPLSQLQSLVELF